jgi:4-carboxymuconolactone decarboxylase
MLDSHTRALLSLAAALGTRKPAEVRRAAVQAARQAEPLAVDEVLLQSHLFIGFPDAIEALAIWREASGRPAQAGLDEAPESWSRRGERVCATVYGANYPRLRANVTALHPEMDRWMVEGGYGRVIGRPGLDLVTRELAIVALLATWGAPRQLHSHLRGALNAGATVEQVDAAVNLACEMLDSPGASSVLQLWTGIRARAEAA